ncbi:MAG TPA: hypothetical protein VFN35_17310 [Ktedonobacteraceae bacterium]|nr:hypothetical protein [Ktedonobacteraceae bacterium]
MSQNAQFEEEFRDGPQATSYQTGYTQAPPAGTYMANVPGQKLVIGTQPSSQSATAGARLALAIVSLIFVFVMFMAAIFISALAYYRYDSFSGIIVFLSLVFAAVAVLVNLIFNIKR